MNFESIARKACERHDYVRAVVTLSRGLKRLEHVDCEAFDLLIDLYANHCVAPGLEREVAEVIARHFDAGLISGQIIAILDERDLFSMSRAFHREMTNRRVIVEDVSFASLTIPPEPTSEPASDDILADEQDEHEAVSEDLTTPPPPALMPSPEDRSGRYPIVAPAEDASSWLPAEDDHEEGDASLSGGMAHERSEPSEVGDLAEPSEEMIERFEAPREIEWTDEVERSEDAFDARDGNPAADAPVRRSVAAKAPATPGPSHAKGGAQESPRRGVFWWASVLGVCVVIALLVGYLYAPDGTQVKAMEQQLEAFDTLNPNAFELVYPDGSAEDEAIDGDAALAVVERREFVHMLVAFERGEVLPDSRALAAISSEELGAWGRGALVWSAMQRRDMEAALAHIEAMERKFPDELPTLWVRARHAEERGLFFDAQKSYARALELYPRFLAGLMGQIRVTFQSGQSDALKHALQVLEASHPEHPYLGIEADLWFEQLATWTREMAGDMDAEQQRKQRLRALEAVGETDRFTRSYNHYVAARQAKWRGDLEQANLQLRDALALEQHMAPALLFQGVLQATQHRTDMASKTFARYVAMEQLDILARLAAMVHAPRTLREAGRPDLALIFALEPGQAESPRRKALLALDEEVQAQEERWRPVWLDLSASQRQTHTLATRRALLELGWTLLELGAAQDVLQLLKQINEDELDAEVQQLLWFSYLVMGSTQRLNDQAYQLRDAAQGVFPAALTALSEHDRLALFMRLRDQPAVSLVATQAPWPRVKANAALALRPADEVLSELDHAAYAARPLLVSRQKLKALARFAPTDGRYIKLKEAQESANYKGVHALLDLCETLLWEPDLEAAQAALDAAQNLAPAHPEVLYLRALILAVQGQARTLDKHLETIGLEALDPIFLLDIASLSLRMGNKGSASNTLASLRQAEPDAEGLWIDRMGTLMLELDEASMRDTIRALLVRHQGEAHVKGRARLLKWLAILSGSRKGEQEGLSFLEQAIAIEQAPHGELWLEKGRYFAARGQNETARDSFDRALRYNSSLADAHLGLAQLAAKQEGEGKETARAHWIRYLELRPYGPDSVAVRKKLDALNQSAREAPGGAPPSNKPPGKE